MSTGTKPPAIFWIIAVLALVWNLMGVGAYLFEAMNDAAALSAKGYSDVEVDAVVNRPGWATGIFAIAVFGGAIGCIGLLLRKKWALWPLIISLAAVIIQQIYMWGMTDAATHISGTGWIMPIMIPVIAIFLVWFAKRMTGKHILK